MNSVVLVGRAGQDPEMRYFDSGKVKTSFSVAVNRWDGKSKSEVTDWFNVELWDKVAEVAGEYVKKGTLLALEGWLKVNKWQDKEYFCVNATNMRLLSKRNEA